MLKKDFFKSIKVEEEERCEFYPKVEDGCICYAGSDISGPFICTKEFSNKCRYAKEQREKRR